MIKEGQKVVDKMRGDKGRIYRTEPVLTIKWGRSPIYSYFLNEEQMLKFVDLV